VTGPGARDDRALTHDERLWAPLGWWVVATVIVGTFGIAIGYPLGLPAGVATFAAFEAVVVWALVASAARVQVGDGVVRAGRARLPFSAVGRAVPLDKAAAALLRGRDADPRAYLLLRPWLPMAVRLDLDDPRDPAPYWYLSTRRPAELASSISAAAAAGGPGGDAARPDAAG
jgi:Protein of unknown function (DUF3093)